LGILNSHRKNFQYKNKKGVLMVAVAEEQLKVQGMSCNHCKMAVEKALKNLAGVSGAEVDLAGGTVRVSYDPGAVKHENLVAAIEQAGYTVTG
jgi:copper chaperone